MLKWVMIAAVFAVLVGSCQLVGSRPSDETVKNAVRMENALANSNMNITYQSKWLLAEFESALQDPRSEWKAKIWSPKADSAFVASERTLSYLEVIKADIAAEGKSVDSTSLNSNKTITQKIFFDKGKGVELFSVIRKYRKELLDVDSNVFKEFEFTLPFDTLLWNQKYSDKQLAQEYFSNLCVAEARALVTKFENDVINSSVLVIRFLRNRGTTTIDTYDDGYVIFAGVNSSYLKPGQDLWFIIGKGAFSTRGNPVAYIDGKKFSLNNQGVVEYKTRVKKEGKFRKKITVKFLKEDGTEESIDKIVEYEVSNCAGIGKME